MRSTNGPHQAQTTPPLCCSLVSAVLLAAIVGVDQLTAYVLLPPPHTHIHTFTHNRLPTTAIVPICCGGCAGRGLPEA
eukprot:352403-Chlamydomonas_euryale.AAC.1